MLQTAGVRTDVSALQRGVIRLLHARGFAAVSELSLATGRRPDLVAVGPAAEIWAVEIKSCAADFRADRKWLEYQKYCDELLFAVDRDFPLELIPPSVGLIVADGYGGEILRVAPRTKLPPATRKAMLLRVARAASCRLTHLIDPALAEIELR